MTFKIGTPHAHNAGYSWSRYSADTRVVEDDVQTCPHCQAVIRMRQWSQTENGKMSGGFCGKCSAPVCPHCQARMAKYGCEPFLKKLEQELDMTVKLQQFIKDAGLEPARPHQPIFTG